MRTMIVVTVLGLVGCYVETRPVARPVAVVQAEPVAVQTEAPPSSGGEVVVTNGGSHPPIVCAGSEDIVLDGVSIEGEVAVHASGSCNVVLTNCTLRASHTAIVAAGSADVQLRGCNVAAPVAVDAAGSADVAIAGSNVQGEVRAAGSADVVRM